MAQRFFIVFQTEVNVPQTAQGPGDGRTVFGFSSDTEFVSVESFSGFIIDRRARGDAQAAPGEFQLFDSGGGIEQREASFQNHQGVCKRDYIKLYGDL